MDLDTRPNSKQISYNVENPLHELIVIQVNCIWINLLLIEVVSDSTWAVENDVMQHLHENRWVAVHCSEEKNIDLNEAKNCYLLGFIILSRKLNRDQREHELITSFLDVSNVAEKCFL